MGVLKFNGTSDRLKWTTLASALSTVSAGAYTSAYVFKRATVGGDFDALSYLLSGTGNGVAEAGASITTGNRLLNDAGGSEDTNASNPLFNTTNAVYMAVVSKAAGNGAQIYSQFVKSSSTWNHYTSSALGDQTAATMLEIGAWQAANDFFRDWMGIVAYWSGEMTQANKQALATNWKTSDLWNSAHGQPVFLAQLNIAGASVVDLAGNASALTATGTTLDSGETLSAWNFDGTGAGGGGSTPLDLSIPSF